MMTSNAEDAEKLKLFYTADGNEEYFQSDCFGKLSGISSNS
jgi:hypothetical protein